MRVLGCVHVLALLLLVALAGLVLANVETSSGETNVTPPVENKSVHSLSLGLPGEYEWHTLREGLQHAQKTLKPIMLVIWIHDVDKYVWFRDLFSHPRIQELSKQFVMVTANPLQSTDTAEPGELLGYIWPKAFDGPYTPRIVFLEPFGQVSRIMNREIRTHRFFYRTASQIFTSMEDAIDLIVRHNNDYDPGTSEPNEHTQDSVPAPAERAEPISEEDREKVMYSAKPEKKHKKEKEKEKDKKKDKKDKGKEKEKEKKKVTAEKDEL